MNQITSFIPEALTYALGWTLLHSLWQGAFVALLLSLLLVLLHRQSARVRYAVAGGAMLAQLLLAVGTFTYYYKQLPQPASTFTSYHYLAAPPATKAQAASAGSSFYAAPFEVAQAYFEQHMPLLVMLWLLGMLIMTLRFIGGVAYTQRLRHYKALPLEAHWQQKLNTLCQAMGMQKVVLLMESALVQVPMAIGLAKPVILLPIGAVTGLTQAQVEAVLAHELAHILRRDYLVNLLQSVVDLLFFYHPAVWWVSGVVRAERENCCDDIAVAICGDTLTYARALAEIEAMRLPAAPAMALAFSGKRGSLMNRIKRLVGQQSLKPSFTEGFTAAMVLVVGLLVLSFGAVAGLKPQAEQDTTRLAQGAAPEDSLISDEANDAEAFSAQDDAGNTRDVVIIKNKRGKVKELYVDGKRIPNKHIDEYKDLIDQRLQAVRRAPRATSEEVKAELKEARAAAAEAQRGNRGTYSFHYGFSEGDSLMPPPPPPPAPPVPALPPMPEILPPIPPVPPIPPIAPFEDDKEAEKAYKEDMKEYEAEMKEFEKEMKNFQKEIEEYNKELRESGVLDEAQYREQVEQHRAMAEYHVKHNQEIARHQQELALQHQKMAKKHEEQFQKVKAEMVKDGIIKKGDDELNIQINNGELHVNGKKQPQAVYEKYKKLMNIEVSDSSNFRFQYNTK